MSGASIVSTIASLFSPDGGKKRPYECEGCLERFEIQYHSCPECGSYRVNRSSWSFE